jgi:Protein of unknown function (DUF1588)/Protein of unknown function (DUF1592)/Protein of unknown function (DUF1587)/Protein of unknown function (DUF1585)/Protein of unknown function (DUF1595)
MPDFHKIAAMRSHFSREVRRTLSALLAVAGALAFFHSPVEAADSPAVLQFRNEIQPILENYCYDCHADGAENGKVSFDKLETDAAILDPVLWHKVLKNVRAGLMPPPKEETRPSPGDVQKLENWIKFGAFGIDPANPDPGRVTIRRLNRAEYHNAIRDLIGGDFDTLAALPPDDVGYGFDNIGDVLSISPMRMEKFIEAAIAAVDKSVPMDTVAISSRVTLPYDYLSADGSLNGDRLSFYDRNNVATRFHARVEGDYRLHIAAKVDGAARPDPQRARVRVYADDLEFFKQEYHWSDAEYFDDERVVHLTEGDHYFSFTTEPLLDVEPLPTRMDYRILYVRIDGPLDRKNWVHAPNYKLLYDRDAPPTDPVDRRAYAREVLARFVPRAFRRPVSEETLDRLVDLAVKTYSAPGVTFEKGIAQAIVAVLASPRFLFHFETDEPVAPGQTYARIDEYSLASRLSFALWSSIPDDELTQLAAHGELRKNFRAQVSRMLADPKAQAFVENFTGQWLQSRGVLDTPINSAEVMARDGLPYPATAPAEVANADPNAAAAVETRTVPGVVELPLPDAPAAGARQGNRVEGQLRPRRPRTPVIPPGMALTPEVRIAMKQEVEAYFGHIVHDDRSVIELLKSDYTFVNEALAPVYGIPNISGPEMRLVKLPPNDPRGGVLTMGSTLTVTSNPARTSPVKRGKWILENILGSPPAPPPPNIPALEDAKAKTDHEPTQRELLALHRDNPLCASCHARMDPPGLALENFNAFGRARTKESGRLIDPAGELATGETFADVRELKQALVDKHRMEFYRTITGKLMTYVLGRGVEYYDIVTIDNIAEQMDKQDGRFSTLLFGILESAPFQQRSPTANAATLDTAPSTQENVAK